MTSEEYAAQLRSIADLYEANPALPIGFGLSIYLDSKEQVRSVLKMVGGKWSKEIRCCSTDYHVIVFTHIATGLCAQVPRDKVCRKVLRYECEPIMTPEEEAELDLEVVETGDAI